MMQLFILLLGATATSVSPVQKVIQLLDELKGKVPFSQKGKTIPNLASRPIIVFLPDFA